MSPDAIVDSQKVAIYNGSIATVEADSERVAPAVYVVAQQVPPESRCCSWPAPLAACSAATALVVIAVVVTAAAIFTCNAQHRPLEDRSLGMLSPPRRVVLTTYNNTDNGTQEFPWMANCPLPANTTLSFALWSEQTYLTQGDRIVYLALFAVVGGAAVALNVAELYVVFTRKYRLMLRCCLGSLAASDLLLSVFATISNISNLSNPILRWNLGAGMCGAVPLLEFSGALANALTLALVAWDRYRSLLLAQGPARWDPAAPACTACLAVIWVLAFGVASPSVSLFEVLLTLVVVVDEGLPTDCRLLERCYDNTGSSGKTYMRVLFGFIFIPLLIAFLVLHAVVASFVWRKRKPFASVQASGTQNARRAQDGGGGGGTTSNSSGDAQRSNNATASSDTATGRTRNNNNNTTACVASPCGPFQRAPSAKTSPHTVRNMRSFRRIVVMMALFFACRLPNWLFNIVHDAAGRDNEYAWWLARYGVNLLALFNSVVNPLLYCFFNETLSAAARLRNWLTRPCRPGAEPQQQQPRTQRDPPRPPSIVPRGPYYDAEHRSPALIQH